MKKITALFLALALCLSLCTVTAFAKGQDHHLTVTKADGSAVTAGTMLDGSDGADYHWHTSGGDTWLVIFKDGLTVSGTTTSERIVVEASATDLTIKNLKITHSSSYHTSPLVFIGTATLTLVGDNELTCTDAAALRFEIGANGTIAGAGNLIASCTGDMYPAGIMAGETLTFTQTGTVTASGACGIYGRNGVSFNNGIGKILARGTEPIVGAVYGAVTLGDALTMKGSTAVDTAEASITGETTIVGDNVKTSDQVALSVLIGDAEPAPTPRHHHSSTTTTPTVTSATTADMGVALYGVLSVSSLLGMGWVSKKKH